MSMSKWFASNADYARKLGRSGWEGARRAVEEFLDGEPVGAFLNESAQRALKAAGAGIYFGLLGAYLDRQRKSAPRVLTLGFLGGAIGFGVGLVCGTQHLTGEAARGALKSIGPVRDARWLEKNPITYA